MTFYLTLFLVIVTSSDIISQTANGYIRRRSVVILGKTNDRGASCCQESSERVAGKATWSCGHLQRCSTSNITTTSRPSPYRLSCGFGSLSTNTKIDYPRPAIMLQRMGQKKHDLLNKIILFNLHLVMLQMRL
jgi:hypothetical protein